MKKRSKPVIETSASIAKLSTAILQVQGNLSGVRKDAVNPHFRNRYATLENVIDTARPVLQEAGIAFIQAPGTVVDGSVEVTTMLIHDGEWMRSTLHVPLQKRDAQGVGSAITYGCRYSLMAMLGLPPTDDDGQEAVQPEPPAKRQVGWSKDGTTRTAHSLKKEKVWDEFQMELRECETPHMVTKLALAWSKKVEEDSWPESWKALLREEMEKRMALLKSQPAPDDDVFPADRPSNIREMNVLGAG